jgi:hypothetical protein
MGQKVQFSDGLSPGSEVFMNTKSFYICAVLSFKSLIELFALKEILDSVRSFSTSE